MSHSSPETETEDRAAIGTTVMTAHLQRQSDLKYYYY